MPGDALHVVDVVNDWRQRSKALGEAATRLKIRRDQVSEELEDRRREIDQLSLRLDKLTKVGELLRKLMDLLVLDQVKAIEEVVSKGLHAIFSDLPLAFEAEVTTRYNRTAIDFFLKQGQDETAIRGAPLDSFGGGPSSVASLILRLLAILRLNRAPILVLDETLAAVSDEYIDDAGRFLARLAETAKIDILLVTHKASFLDHADHAWQGFEETEDDGTWNFGLRRIRGPQ